MIVSYIFLVFPALLVGFFVITPLYKKRPIVITVPLPSLRKLWFVYGITGTLLSEALEKAALATMTPIEKSASWYKIDGMTVKFYSLSKTTNFISLHSAIVSKKAKLTKAVFKKFMQNYFIR